MRKKKAGGAPGQHPGELARPRTALQGRVEGSDGPGFETRVCVPDMQPRQQPTSAYDRVLATEFSTYAAKLVEADHYGVAVAANNIVTENVLKDIAGKTSWCKTCDMLTVARRMGVSLG